MMNKKIVFIYYLYFIIGIIYFIVLKEILNIIEVYYNYVQSLLIIIYIMIGFITPIINKKMMKNIYLIYLFIFLFLRETKSGFNFDFYLDTWIKNILNNKTIFVNVLGNIILFIPLGIIFEGKIIYPYITIILLELLQVVLNKGIFDIVDIVLNFIGISIGILGVYIWMIIKRKKLTSKKIKM